MLEILMFLLKGYANNTMGLLINAEKLSLELEDIGCDPEQVAQAFGWLQTILDKPEQSLNNLTNSQAMRVYSDYEIRRLDVGSRGLLYFLESKKIIDTAMRELIIDRALALDVFEISLENIKWVISLVMLNDQTQDRMLDWLTENEDLHAIENIEGAM